MKEYGWFIAHQMPSVPLASTQRQKQDEHIVLVDHYDSFTQLIKAHFEVLGASVSVLQFDDKALNQLKALAPTRLVFSPGPGSPQDVAATQAIILKYHQHYPMLGICLGHQCLIEAFGGQVVQASEICHGKQFKVYHTGEGVFQDMPKAFFATRYHSLLVSEKALPKTWQVTAWTEDTLGQQVIMGIQHQTYPLFGVQYHPEAILTEQGMTVFQNFLLT